MNHLLFLLELPIHVDLRSDCLDVGVESDWSLSAPFSRLCPESIESSLPTVPKFPPPRNFTWLTIIIFEAESALLNSSSPMSLSDVLPKDSVYISLKHSSSLFRKVCNLAPAFMSKGFHDGLQGLALPYQDYHRVLPNFTALLD